MIYLDIHTHQPTAESVFTPRCFGIHPWLIEQPLQVAPLLQRLTLLEQGKGTVDFDLIGECGIDRCRPTHIAQQIALFERQIILAEKLHKTIVIHCVRATDLLLSLRKAHPTGLWIYHGFTATAATAQQLLQAHIIPSFGSAITDPRRTKPRQALQALGIGNFFLETDTSTTTIQEIYRTAATLLSVSEEQLLQSMPNWRTEQ